MKSKQEVKKASLDDLILAALKLLWLGTIAIGAVTGDGHGTFYLGLKYYYGSDCKCGWGLFFLWYNKNNNMVATVSAVETTTIIY
jgi:hypothetical protein